MTSLNPFSWSAVSGNLQVPIGLAGGFYYLVYSIDAFGDVAEFDETNNRSYVPQLSQVSVDPDDQLSEALSATVGGAVGGAYRPAGTLICIDFLFLPGSELGLIWIAPGDRI